jgi:hypothetical protein
MQISLRSQSLIIFFLLSSQAGQNAQKEWANPQLSLCF